MLFPGAARTAQWDQMLRAGSLCELSPTCSVRTKRGHTVLLLDEHQNGRGQIVTEAPKCLGQLTPFDRSGPVSIEMKEDVLPVRYVFIQSRKFCLGRLSEGMGDGWTKGMKPLKPIVPLRSVS
jgi:hypothetical protein